MAKLTGWPALCAAALFVLPESPRWLVVNNRLDEALVVIGSVYKSAGLANGETGNLAHVACPLSGVNLMSVSLPCKHLYLHRPRESLTALLFTREDMLAEDVEQELMELWSNVEKEKAARQETTARHHLVRQQSAVAAGSAAASAGERQRLVAADCDSSSHAADVGVPLRDVSADEESRRDKCRVLNSSAHAVGHGVQPIQSMLQDSKAPSTEQDTDLHGDSSRGGDLAPMLGESSHPGELSADSAPPQEGAEGVHALKLPSNLPYNIVKHMHFLPVSIAGCKGRALLQASACAGCAYRP